MNIASYHAPKGKITKYVLSTDFLVTAQKNWSTVVPFPNSLCLIRADSDQFRPFTEQNCGLIKRSGDPPMRKPVFSHAVVSAFLFSLTLMGATNAVAQQRRTLPTHLAAPATEPAIAPMPVEQPISFGFALPVRNQAALQSLLQDQRNPASPRYRQYLTAQQFLAQYGPTQADYNRVIAFARSHGFTVTRTFSNRLLVNVRGTPPSINQAFAVRMQTHQRADQARKYYAPDVEPTVDSSLPILTIVGLSTRDLPHPMLVHAKSDARGLTTGSGQNGQFLGSDMRAAYAPGVTLDGAGQTVGLVELGPYNVSDVQAYFSAVNQPLKVPIYNVLLDVDGVCSGIPSNGGCDDGEEVIDIEQAISMAPGLSGLIVYEAYGSGSDALTAFSQAASDDTAKQLSLSFGFGGTPATQPGYEQVFMELGAQGQNLFIASGDSGANVGGVGYPGNSPNVTDVGGTDLTTAGAGGAWASETAWIGSGGGWNTQSPIPSYQTPVINSANQGSSSFRNIPDVAMEANTDNFFCANGSCQGGIGGTSLAAPRWAGFLALANEQADGNPIGFLNTIYYSLGQTSTYANVFHDIVEGNNFNQSSPNLFQAVPGYDLTSGWGTPNGQSLIDTLAPASLSAGPNFVLVASPAKLPLTPGSTATTQVTVAPIAGFSGTVELSSTPIGAPAGVTVELGIATLPGSGQTTLTVTTSSATPGGNFVVAVTGVSGGISHTAYVELSLPDFSLQASPGTIYLNQQGRATGTVSVDAINGFDGSVALALAGLPPGVTGRLSPQSTARASTLSLHGAVTAVTTSGVGLNVTGTSAGNSRTVPALALAVSAATGDCGLGAFVDLKSAYNVAAIRQDNTTFSDGGLDGAGFAYSATLLGNARVLNGIHFELGASNTFDAVYGTGQTIALPAGHYNTLQILGTGIEGNQANQPLTVTYSDGTTAKFTQSFSDWFVPSVNVNEGEAVAMPYRNTATGQPDARQFNLYRYTLILDPAKTVKSLTLPTNRDIVVFAATLALQPLGVETQLAGAFNASGIYSDGSTFPADGGLDGGGAAYSANLLQDTAVTGEEVVAGTSRFHLGAPNVTDVVYAAGQTIQLPSG
ncbi:MAG TPA: S53 family serine peptidase, partial [Acidobacteriaceae bacterium]|nr:S53 family serine peptidase [Acidobacteriaceae bacterium]